MAAAGLCRFLNISAFLVLVLASLVCSLSFNLPHISSEDTNVHIKVEGDAYVSGQGIQVTPNERGENMGSKAGRAMYVDSLHLWDKATGELADFSTNFTFNIDSDDNRNFADGLAFFLAKFSTPFNKTVTAGGGLGLVNPNLVTSPEPVVAVVFDTFSSQKNKPLTNVSINVNSMKLPATSIAWLNNITQGMDNTAHITYNASSKFLRVVFTGFWDGDYQTDSLSYELDLRDYLPEFVSIGFSAATGFLFEKQTVSSWQFDSTPLRSSDSVSVPPAPSPSKPAAPTGHTVVIPEEKSSKKGLVMGLSIGVLVFVVLLGLAIYACFKKKWASKGDNQIILGQAIEENQNTIGRAMDGEFERAGTGAKKFSYTELATATKNFSEEQKLGEGGFGGVYLGILRGIKVAVKRVSRESKQGKEEYASEVKIISRLRHRNLVPLQGWCHEKQELLLVYEYMPEGSLDHHLFKKNSPLNWKLRYRIAQGLASALSYLHEDWEQCILHRDIKSSNVLLDSTFNARLGDFGLAWLVDHGNAPQKTYLGGTPGYIAPECHRTYKTSKQSDVYSFGVVALEIACGRRAIIPNGPEGVISLVDWVWDLYGMGKLLEAADPKLCGNFEGQEMERLMVIGLWCAHPDSDSRPNITQVVHCLKFQVQLPILPPKMPKPVYSTCTSAISFSSDYNTNSSSNTHFTSSSVSTGSSTSSSVLQTFLGYQHH